MTPSPLVSIIIPTYYRNDRLRSTIESALNQEYDPVEIVVVDDSGEAHAEAVVSEYDVHYVANSTNRGLTLSRKIGLDESAGEFVHFVDDDDRLFPNAISGKMALLIGSDDRGVVYSGYQLEKGRKVMPKKRAKGDVSELALMFDLAPCIPSTMLIDRNDIEQVALSEIHELGVHNEHGMQIELAQRTEYDYVDEVHLFRGEPEESRGTTLSSVREYYQTIEQYSELYDQHADHVRRVALGYTYLMDGQAHITNSTWSPHAIEAFARAALTTPGVRSIYIGSLVASVFGRPGYELGRRIYANVLSEDRQRGKGL